MRVSASRCLMAALAAAAFLVSAPHAQAQNVVYEVKEVKAPFGSGNTVLLSLNNAGWVAGVANDGGPFNIGFVYDGTSYTKLPPLPGAQFAWPTEIFDNGRVIGRSGPNFGQYTGFVWQAGKLLELRRPTGHVIAFPAGGNGLGTIVGLSWITGGPTARPVLWQNGVLHMLPLSPGTTGAWLQDVNNKGQIVGYDRNAGTFPFLAFLIEGGKKKSLGTLGGDRSALRRINDAGQAIGQSRDASGVDHGVIWQDGVFSLIPLLSGFTDAIPADINRAGQVVGRQSPVGGGLTAPFISDGVQTFDLSTMLDPVTSAGWTRLQPVAINAHGQIACAARNPANEQVGCILTPFPVPPE